MPKGLIFTGQQILDGITAKMNDFLNSQKFKKDGDYSFSNELISIKLDYDEGTKTVALYLNGETEEEAKKLCEWSCTAESLSYDGDVIAEDFIKTLYRPLGISDGTVSGSQVTIPVKNKAGTEMNLDAFTAKFLNIYPEYKELYKQDVAEYGEYLYVDFFKKTALQKLRESVSANNTKAVGKMLALMAEAYYEGTAEASDVAVGLICAGAFYDCPEKFTEMSADLAESKPLFVTAVRSTIATVAKNKKFAALIA